MSARLSGHALCAEGKPCKRTDRRRSEPISYEIIHGASTGSALCECGEKSPALESDGARKRWHRAHKEQVRGGHEALNGNLVTEEEKVAIEALERQAKRWPRSLTLASMGSSLVVFHTGDERWEAVYPSMRAEAIVADDFGGIPNDGGDW